MKRIKGVSRHAQRQTIRRKAPAMTPKRLVRALKRGKARIEPAFSGRWAFFYRGFVYITNPEKDIIISVLTEEEFRNQRGQQLGILKFMV